MNMSRLSWARCATFKLRFSLNEPAIAFPSGLETMFLQVKGEIGAVGGG